MNDEVKNEVMKDDQPFPKDDKDTKTVELSDKDLALASGGNGSYVRQQDSRFTKRIDGDPHVKMDGDPHV